jgi:hypothetical protein
VFPRELVAREEQLLREMLAEEPQRAMRYSTRAHEEAFLAVSSQMPAQYLDAVANPQKHKGKSDLLCNASILMYQTVLSLTSVRKAAALEGMFKAGG